MNYTEEELRYLRVLSQQFPTIAAAASEIIRIEAITRLPKGTEHFMSDLHGENEAFLHILNSASGVIREKIDQVLGEDVPAAERAELATLVYYPVQKLPELKAAQQDLGAWYRKTLLRLIEVCRLVSSKHTRAHVRRCLPKSCAYILDELLHAHFEDHDKDLYYGQIIESILRYDRADAYITRFCQVIKHLAVDTLHIIGDLFDRGPRPDLILDQLMAHHDVDIQWGNHDVVWMGAAAGSPVCIFTVLKTSLAYGNLDLIETGYGISLRGLERLASSVYGGEQAERWVPHLDPRVHENAAAQRRNAGMHKAVTLLLFKLEAQVIARNPDFGMQGRDYLNQIDYAAGTVRCGGKTYPLTECDFPTVDPADPTALTPDEQELVGELVHAFTQSERLQRHVQFLYARGAVYKVINGNLLFHGAVPMTADGEFAPDMANVSKHTGLTKEEIVSIHTSCDYLIYMLGFLPGFAYLGGMDERLVTPRLESPRLEIKKGSVGIGGEQTGIYPVASPGGWQIIGKTPVDVYDRNKENPILYRAGDYIRFVPVSADRYYEIEEMIKNNSYSVESEEVVK